MIKAVIFDLDGTLLDTRQDLANSINLVLKNLNKPQKSQQEIISCVGNGIKKLVEDCINPIDNKEDDKAFGLFQEFYSKEFLKTTYPYKGLPELVNKIEELNIKIGVNSNKEEIFTKELIKKHYKNIDLEYVIGNKEGLERKPSPQAVEMILNSMGINKKEALYIGDSPVDIKTARNANIDLICVGWGFKSKEELLKEENVKIVETPDEILKYIKEKNNA